MKKIILISFLFLTSCINQINMPESLPRPTGSMVIMSLANEIEVEDEKYSGTELNTLKKLDGHYYIIDSKTVISNKGGNEFLNLLRSNFGESEEISLCFIPRHAVQYESRYGLVKALICFECNKVYISIGEWGSSKQLVKPLRKQVDQFYKSIDLKLPVNPKDV